MAKEAAIPDVLFDLATQAGGQSTGRTADSEIEYWASLGRALEAAGVSSVLDALFDAAAMRKVG